MYVQLVSSLYARIYIDLRAISASLRDDRHYKRSPHSSLTFASYVITFELGYLHRISTR